MAKSRNTKKNDKSAASTVGQKAKGVIDSIWNYTKAHLWPRIVLGTLLIIVVSIMTLGVAHRIIHRNDPIQIGVSFSPKYSQEIGNDWPQNYLALLEDLNIKKFRLMSYWNDIESNNNEFNFSGLDWQMDEAAKNNAKVSLAVGLRQPRWPECHYPGWAEELSLEQSQSELLEYLAVVVNRYKDHPALESYQLENEVANKHFGDCPEYDRDFYAQEFDLIKSLDPDTTLITSVSNQSGFQVGSLVGDKVGFSVYKRAHFELAGRQVSWSFWYVPSWWHGMRAMAVEILHGTDTFIHELQAEPWGPAPTNELSLEEQFKTMDPNKFIEITNYAERIGMKEYYLWGGEWWYWLKTEKNDDSMWQAVKTKIQSVEVQY